MIFGSIFLPFPPMSVVCQTTMNPLDVHPPIAGGMHALESKGHTPLICGIRIPFFCVVGQPSVWSTLVGEYLTPFITSFWAHLINSLGSETCPRIPHFFGSSKGH